MGDRGLIDKAKKASVMTYHGYKKAVGWSQKPADWIVKEHGSDPYNSLKQGVTEDQQTVLPDMRNAESSLYKYPIEILTKSKQKYKKKAEEAYKNYKEETKDYKELRKEICKKYDLKKKDVKNLSKHYKENRQLYSDRIGPRTERENYFLDLVDKKNAAKEALAKQNALKRKATKKQAAITALKKVDAARNDLRTGSSLSSDDLYAAGNKSLVGSVNSSVKNKAKKEAIKLANKLTKNLAGKLINPLQQLKRYIIGLITSAIANILAYIFPFLMLLVVVAAGIAAITGIARSILSFFGIGGDDDDNSNSTRESATFSEDKIDELVAEREGLTDDQEKLIRYALEKVGKEYTTVDEVNDGMSRTGPDSYDCSGLAYDVEKHIGKDITASTAAGQAEMLMNQGKYLQDTSKPPQVGDLIYYADPPDEVRDKNKDKWNYIYHVAIYVGNGYVVEAFDNDEGVIYGPLRSKNAFAICTP